MRILHTLSSLESSTGGPARSVPGLAGAMAATGSDVSLWTQATGAGYRAPVGVRLEIRDGLRSPDCLGEFDLAHDHGLWLPANHRIAAAARQAGIPFVSSPRGTLEPWALNHRKWKKRVAWWLYQRQDLAGASLLHATASSEAEQFRRLGLRPPIAVIPNGVAVPNLERRTTDIGHRMRTALFLSRIHPKKGLPILLDAWTKVAPEGWRLRIVGPDEGGHLAELKRLCAKLGLKWKEEGGALAGDRLSMLAEDTEGFDRKIHGFSANNGQQAMDNPVVFSPTLDGAAKWQAYRDADLFILPTHSENFGIVIAEALGCGVPVITTHGTPWKCLEDERCGWWVPVEVDMITAALRDATGTSPEELAAMGERGRAIVRRDFGWEKIAEQMIACYRWLLGRGEKPDCVWID